MPSEKTDQDVVTRIIRYCLQNRENADRMFKTITGGDQEITVDGEKIVLSEADRGEFVERFSSEVEPTLWESKRRKDQI